MPCCRGPGDAGEAGGLCIGDGAYVWGQFLYRGWRLWGWAGESICIYGGHSVESGAALQGVACVLGCIRVGYRGGVMHGGGLYRGGAV